MSGNAVWFEIPTLDFERAVRFYESVFELKLRRENIGGDLGMFPGGEGMTGGALIAPHPDNVPNASGAVIYMNGGHDLAPVLARVVKAGGAVMLPKTALPPGMGHFAHFKDCEGNRIGLHSMQ
jgi:uncharacterized protein